MALNLSHLDFPQISVTSFHLLEEMQGKDCFSKKAGKEKGLELSFTLIQINLKHFRIHSWLRCTQGPQSLSGQHESLFLLNHMLFVS